jgi:hypothetical protein
VLANDDAVCRAIAEQIHQVRPQWLILWGTYSRRYWAFPLFDMQPRRLVHASYPEALVDRLDAAERRDRIWPEEVTGDDSDPR